MSATTHLAKPGRLARVRDWTRPTKTVAAVILVIMIGVMPAVALAKFSSSPTAAITVSSGPLPPTAVKISCAAKKLTITWTAPAGKLPTSYTLWITFNGKEPYSSGEKTIPGSQTSETIEGLGLTYTVALKALYGSWTSGLSAPSNSVKC
jgi:hypothetical protein